MSATGRPRHDDGHGDQHDDDMEWVPVAEYGAVHEADFAVATLTSAGIPAQVVGADHVGIFGPGWAGFSPRGLTVAVPAGSADEARSLLGLEDENGT